MSIATTHGDRGQTGLVGGLRISKADLRVEAYGTVDELNTVLGFARSICTNREIHDWTEEIQRTLFRLGPVWRLHPRAKRHRLRSLRRTLRHSPSWSISWRKPKEFSPTGRFRAPIRSRPHMKSPAQSAVVQSAIPSGSHPVVWS